MTIALICDGPLALPTAIWQTSYSGTLDSNLPDRSPTNIHAQITAAVLSVNGGTKIRLTLTGPTSGEGTRFNSIYACKTAGTPLQVTVPGQGADFTVAAGATVVTDEIAIARGGADIFVGFYLNDTAADQLARRISTAVGVSFLEREIASDESSTPEGTSGYTTISNSMCCITKVEEFAVP